MSYINLKYLRYAVCGYSLEEIDASFDGDYLFFNEGGEQVNRPLRQRINVSFIANITLFLVLFDKLSNGSPSPMMLQSETIMAILKVM